MSFQPVVLSTDALIYILLGTIVAFAFYVRNKEHLRGPWRRVALSASGMVGLTVLLAFVAIGLLDSVHFRPRLASVDAASRPVYGIEVLSVLDLALSPLRTRREKTYSAPLATQLYTQEPIELQDGSQARGYPRLKYGGAHLSDPDAERERDLANKALRGGTLGLLGAAALVLLGTAIAAKRRRTRMLSALCLLAGGKTEIPWRALAITLTAIFVLGGAMIALAADYHVFGTDKVGQDVLYQSLKSVRTALVIGTLTTLLMLPFGISLGIVAGYFGGWVDDIIQYVYTVLNSIPGVLLIAAFVLMMQVYIDRYPESFPTSAQRADLRLLFLCIILGVTSWTGLCRLLRGETLKLKELEYIQAARAFGVRDHRIITRHILPNVMHLVLITVVMAFSGLVLTEAVLSYVGVGVDPSMQSFGTMINNARLEMAREPMVWWSLAAAFAFMVTLVLAANLFADAIRDAFDPRLQMSAGMIPSVQPTAARVAAPKS